MGSHTVPERAREVIFILSLGEGLTAMNERMFEASTPAKPLKGTPTDIKRNCSASLCSFQKKYIKNFFRTLTSGLQII